MVDLITKVKAEGNSVGGVVTCIVKGCPVGLGEPVFDKLSANLASAMMSINAAKGFEIGMGFEGTKHLGSEVLDNWEPDANDARGMHAKTNFSGGIQGGISNGEDIVMRVAFKPVATLLRDVETVDDCGNATVLKAKGRHDPCVVPRAIPIVEAMAAMTILDAYLMNKTTRL
jgi:chorismate synthase